MRKRGSRAATVAGILVTLATSVGATTATRLLGTGDQVPGAPTGVLFEFVDSAQLEGEWVIAHGYSSIGGGIYAYDGSNWQVVVDETMVDLPGSEPGSGTYLTEWSEHDIDRSGRAAFSATVATKTAFQVGVWTWFQGRISPVVISGTPVPGVPGGIYDGSLQPWVKNGVVAAEVGIVVPDMSANRGVVLWTATDGPVLLVGTEFGSLANLWLGENSVLYLAILIQQSGIYEQGLYPGAPITPVLGPGPAADFAGYGQPSGLAAGFAIFGYPFGVPGFFRYVDGQFERILDETSLDPHSGLPIRFTTTALAASGDRVVFKVAHDLYPYHQELLFVQHGDRSFELMAKGGEPFEGLPLRGSHYLAGGFDGDRLVVRLERVGDSAIWLFDLAAEGGPNPLEIPTLRAPSLVALALVLGCVAVGMVRRRASRTGRPGV